MQGKVQQKHIRLIAILMACILCLLPVTAFAVDGATGGLKWNLSGSTLKISGKGAMPDYTDANMAPWHEMASSIKTVVVEKGITSIGSLAFYNCKELDSVSLPETVTKIGDRAFKNCTSIKRIVLPSSLAEIGEAAFESCENLTGLYLPDQLVSIGDYAFFRCSSIQSITVPKSVEHLGMVTFAYCEGLTSAMILCSIEKIPDWTFYNCTNLVTIYIPQMTREAGENSFHACGKLSSIYYSGNAGDEIISSIRKDPTALASDASITASDQPGGGYNKETNADGDSSSIGTKVISVIEKENTTIVKESETNISFTKDDKSISYDEAERERQSGSGTVESTTTEKTTFTATVDNSDNWSDLADIVRSATEDDEDAIVESNIHMNGSVLNGDDLGKFAGTNATLNITTKNGSRWRIDTKGMTEEDVAGKKYDLEYNISREKGTKRGIDAKEIYKLELNGGLNGQSKVAVNIPGSNAGSYATLYQRKWFRYVEVETVLVDANGDAWFNAAGLSKGTYFIGINAKGVNVGNATVPHTMYEERGIDSRYTLMDADGNLYAVGERESSWGITKKQFSLYAIIGLGAVVLVVTIVMVTINTISKSKRRVAAENEAQAPQEETEEEMSFRIMKEMLSKIKKNDPDNGRRKR